MKGMIIINNLLPVSFLKSEAEKFKIELNETALQKFSRYYELLIEWNEKINLTSITEPVEVAVKHFLDSLVLLSYINIKENATLIDVGTGAGFPGVVLKILKHDLNITLLDSLNKRLVFLKELANELQLEFSFLHSRAEDAGQNPLYRENFDFAVARAVSNLPALCEYCLPLVKKGGVFIALKGPDGEKELKSAEKAIKILGGGKTDINIFDLQSDIVRSVIKIKKISQTPTKYPRMRVNISKNPL